VKNAPFTKFFIDKDIFVIVPVEDDGTYDSRLVYILGKLALKQYSLFDIV
jgi:hypothetical protein